MTRRPQTLSEVKARFERQFTAEQSGCWHYTGAKGPTGYGRFSWDGKLWVAHRAAYELFVGKIPDGLTIDHICNNTSCVNPSHLRPMKHEDNAARPKREMTHCHRGHPLSGANVLTIKGHRHCRTCNNIRNRTFRAKAMENAHDAR